MTFKVSTSRFTSIGIVVALLLSTSINSSYAESKWNPISSQDYIFGYTSFKYACWSGNFSNGNTPVLQVYENGKWIDAAKGEVLPKGSDISTPCETAYPIAIGYQWTVMNPAPPIGLTGSARYSILYRQKLPDVITRTPVEVIKSVPEVITKTRDVVISVPQDVTKTRTVSKSVKVPYIATIVKNGKKTQVIKYKTTTKKVPETYTETVWVDKVETETYSETVMVQKTVTEYQEKVTPGYVSSNGNVMVYPSESAMRQAYSDVATSLLCAFGFSSNCKK